MKIKIRGRRGSITKPAVSTLRYGGNSNCREIRSPAGNIFVVDAGSGVRHLGKALIQEPAGAAIRFCLTHPQWDHLLCIPFFAPAYSDRYGITLCSGPHADVAIQKYLSRQRETSHYPFDFSALNANFHFSCVHDERENGCCPLGSLQCQALPLSHPNGGFGFKFIEHGKTFIFLTDKERGFQHSGGLSRDECVELCRSDDRLLHDAQNTDKKYQRTRGWDHSTYRDSGVKRCGLFHHDPDRCDNELDRRADLYRKRIQQAGSQVECFACS